MKNAVLFVSKLPKTKRIDGKTYDFWCAVNYKALAREVADRVRKQDHNPARVVPMGAECFVIYFIDIKGVTH